jgi:hypothetical protein
LRLEPSSFPFRLLCRALCCSSKPEDTEECGAGGEVRPDSNENNIKRAWSVLMLIIADRISGDI